MDRHRKIIGEYFEDVIDEAFLAHIDPNRSSSMENANTGTNDTQSILDEVDINAASSFGVCKLCKLRGREETPYHVLMECPYTWRGRAEVFGEHDPSPTTFAEWEPARIVSFFTRYNLET